MGVAGTPLAFLGSAATVGVAPEEETAEAEGRLNALTPAVPLRTKAVKIAGNCGTRNMVV